MDGNGRCWDDYCYSCCRSFPKIPCVLYAPVRIMSVSHGETIPSGKLTWLLKMAIEIVDFPMKTGDFPL